jgi:Fur family transcriptional regulator, ferric uptake regulator
MNTDIVQVLKKAGYSATTARKAVFAVLENAEPLTMHELVALLPNIDRSSVYRTVELYERLGIVHRLHIGWKYKIELTNQYQPHHHHITCLRCGKSQPFLENVSLENNLHAIAAEHNFKLENHLIELQGICNSCQ